MTMGMETNGKNWNEQITIDANHDDGNSCAYFAPSGGPWEILADILLLPDQQTNTLNMYLFAVTLSPKAR